MFYLKYQGKRLYINDENVYCCCPKCGKEHRVDLQEILAGGEADLYGTAVYCPACSEAAQREYQTGAADRRHK